MNKYGKHHNYIFITHNGDPATVATISTWVDRWNKMTDKVFYLHSIRHFYCTYLLQIGLEPELVKEIIGWTSLDMIAIYNDATAKDRKWKGLDKLKNSLESNM